MRDSICVKTIQYLGEDNTLPDSEQVVYLHENIIFRFFILAIHVKLLDPLDRQLLLLELDLVRIWSELTREIPYTIGESCRE